MSASTRKATAKRKAVSRGKSEKQEYFQTPVGTFSFPYLTKKHTKENFPGGKYYSNAYCVDFHIDKKDMQTPEAKALIAAVLDTWNSNVDDADTVDSIWDIPSQPFLDMDERVEAGKDVDERLRGTIRVRAKSNFEPTIVGPTNLPIGGEAAEAIKGGDLGRLSVKCYYWNKLDGGVSLNLSAVKYLGEGEALGGGSKAVSIFSDSEEEIVARTDASEDTEDSQADDLDFS